MIPAFLEGVTQALLPCSWVVLAPALMIGVSTRRWAARLAFMGSVTLFVWVAVSGWLSVSPSELTCTP